MIYSLAERRLSAERREMLERRGGPERRTVERRQTLVLVPAEQRSGQDRRRPLDRRSNLERRGHETPAEHIRNALQLLATVAEAGVLDDELQRDLESAMLRLRFAVDRLEHHRG
jgi:hypothetical protein